MVPLVRGGRRDGWGAPLSHHFKPLLIVPLVRTHESLLTPHRDLSSISKEVLVLEHVRDLQDLHTFASSKLKSNISSELLVDFLGTFAIVHLICYQIMRCFDPILKKCVDSAVIRTWAGRNHKEQ